MQPVHSDKLALQGSKLAMQTHNLPPQIPSRTLQPRKLALPRGHLPTPWPRLA